MTRSDPDLGTEGMHEAVPDMHVEFNRYRSSAVLPDPDDVDDGGLDIDPRLSRARPGTRAPHVELRRDGASLSTLDLFGAGFVLLTGPDGGEWRAPAQRVAAAAGLDLVTYVVAQDEAAGDAGRTGGRRGDLLHDRLWHRSLRRGAGAAGRVRRLAPASVGSGPDRAAHGRPRRGAVPRHRRPRRTRRRAERGRVALGRATSRSKVEVEVELLEAPVRPARLVEEGVARSEPQAGQPGQQGPHADGRLGPRQRGTDAVVLAVGEAEVEPGVGPARRRSGRGRGRWPGRGWRRR